MTDIGWTTEFVKEFFKLYDIDDFGLSYIEHDNVDGNTLNDSLDDVLAILGYHDPSVIASIEREWNQIISLEMIPQVALKRINVEPVFTTNHNNHTDDLDFMGRTVDFTAVDNMILESNSAKLAKHENHIEVLSQKISAMTTAESNSNKLIVDLQREVNNLHLTLIKDKREKQQSENKVKLLMEEIEQLKLESKKVLVSSTENTKNEQSVSTESRKDEGQTNSKPVPEVQLEPSESGVNPVKSHYETEDDMRWFTGYKAVNPTPDVIISTASANAEVAEGAGVAAVAATVVEIPDINRGVSQNRPRQYIPQPPQSAGGVGQYPNRPSSGVNTGPTGGRPYVSVNQSVNLDPSERQLIAEHGPRDEYFNYQPHRFNHYLQQTQLQTTQQPLVEEPPTRAHSHRITDHIKEMYDNIDKHYQAAEQSKAKALKKQKQQAKERREKKNIQNRQWFNDPKVLRMPAVGAAVGPMGGPVFDGEVGAFTNDFLLQEELSSLLDSDDYIFPISQQILMNNNSGSNVGINHSDMQYRHNNNVALQQMQFYQQYEQSDQYNSGAYMPRVPTAPSAPSGSRGGRSHNRTGAYDTSSNNSGAVARGGVRMVRKTIVPSNRVVHSEDGMNNVAMILPPYAGLTVNVVHYLANPGLEEDAVGAAAAPAMVWMSGDNQVSRSGMDDRRRRRPQSSSALRGAGTLKFDQRPTSRQFY